MSHSKPYLIPDIVKDFIIFQKKQNVKPGRIIEEVTKKSKLALIERKPIKLSFNSGANTRPLALHAIYPRLEGQRFLVQEKKGTLLEVFD